MAHTIGTAEMSPDVARLLPCSVFKGRIGTPKVRFRHGVALNVCLFGIIIYMTFTAIRWMDEKSGEYGAEIGI